MSGSKAKLEQILELLLSEETERAEELLHEYVVAKARAEYEKVLEADEDDLEASEEEIEGDEFGAEEMGDDEDLGSEDDMDMGDEGDVEDLGDMEDEEEEGEEEGEEDLEDKVDEIQDELDQLRAEFEELMAGEAGEEEHSDMDMGAEDEMSFDMPKEGVAEATQFSKPASVQPMKGASMKGSEDDASNSKSPLSSKPKATTVAGAGSPVKSRDGGEGKHNHGGSVKDHTPTDNMGIEPKKASAPSKPE